MMHRPTKNHAVPSKRSPTRSRSRKRAPRAPAPPTARLSMSVEPALLARVRAIATERDRSVAYVLRALLWKGIRALEAEGDGAELRASD